MEPALYDLIYSRLPHSLAYRETLAAAGFDLPDWVVPLSTANRSALERIAREMRLHAGDAFVDIACGLGGPTLWIAERTKANATGIDFSALAIAHATELAEERGLSSRARFVTAKATNTGLASESFGAAMSIDSLQFVDPAGGVEEIARLLMPGGIAAIATWEALTRVELQTVVPDYRPYFEAAGFTAFAREIVEGAREQEFAHYRAIRAVAGRLRAEMGDGAEPLLREAEDRLRREHDPPRVRKVLIVARKR
jgi:SAM-dependent methyltransferase